MNLNSIQYFITIVQEKSISKAAKKLYVSQPAMSQCIKRLETELNAPLFIPGNRDFQLTQTGELLYQEGTVIFQLYEQLLKKIHYLLETQQEEVYFGISPFYGQYYLPRIIPYLMKNYPHIHYNITEDYSVRLEEKLLAGELDFCAVPLFPQNPLLEYEVISEEEIFLAVPRNHPVNELVTPSPGISYIDLSLVKNEPFISLKPVQKFAKMEQQICEEFGFTPNTVCETLSWDTVDTLVGVGTGVGFVPELLAKKTPGENTPNYYRISTSVSRPYAIAVQKDHPLSASASLMIDAFRKVLQPCSSLPPCGES